jgi:GNAT superfamily N-acetyltransferase
MSQSSEILLVQSATDEVRTLIGELDDELQSLYAPEQRHGLALDAIFQPHIRFFVARVDSKPAGCGGVALFDDFAEIKRMYVRPALRRQGVAAAIMARLIDEAVMARLGVLRLETGAHQHAAIGFYKRSGFSSCAAFTPYAAMPAAAIVTSVFMERRLP